jgi:hypothetical protein
MNTILATLLHILNSSVNIHLSAGQPTDRQDTTETVLLNEGAKIDVYGIERNYT